MHTHTQRETIPLYLFFFGIHFFVDISIPSVRPPVRHREAMLKASPLRPCANRDPHSPHMPPPNVILMLTHGLQAGVTMCCPPPPALAVCPWSCSIFPDKYHPGQSIKDISLFLKHRMTLSLPLPHCYVMLRLSLSPISRSILFTSLHSRHATFASLAPLARLSHQAQRHWAILFVFVKLWHLSLVALYAVQRCTRRVGKLGWCTGLYPCAENMLSLNVA